MADSRATSPNASVMPPRPRRVLRWLGATLLTGLLLLLGAVLAVWVWAGTPGSLARTVSLAQRWAQDHAATVGRLQTGEVQGSLRHGGRIASLDWSLDGLQVHADEVHLAWTDALWIDALLGRGVHIGAIKLGALKVHDGRPPRPDDTEPLNALTLPLDLSLAFAVDRVEISGRTDLTLTGLQGRYLYGAPTSNADTAGWPSGVSKLHHLRLDALHLADGDYQGELRLGGGAPMPLALALQGDIHTAVPDGAGLVLKVQATARGTLGGADAAIDLKAQAIGDAPAGATRPSPSLNLTAEVQPWARQPLVSADLRTRALNLASLWPAAPITALDAQLLARPEGGAWHATLTLDNTLVAPADQHGLPLEHLSAGITQRGKRWTLHQLQARVAGGSVQGQGAFDLDTDGGQTRLQHWLGELQIQGVRPALAWSPLAQGALDGSLSARAAAADAVNIDIGIQPSARQPTGTELAGLRLGEVRVRGQWQPAATGSHSATEPVAGRLTLDEARAVVAGARLQAQGRIDTARRSFDGRLALDLPGSRLNWQGVADHAQGQWQADLSLSDATRLLDWVRSLQDLPVVGPTVHAALTGQEALQLSGQGQARLAWDGGLGALGWPTPIGIEPTRPSAPPRLNASVTVPALSLRQGEAGRLDLNDLALRTEGPLDALQLSAHAQALVNAWRARLDTSGLLRIDPSARDNGQLDLARLTLGLQPAAASSTGNAWTLQNAAPLHLRWQPSSTGELQLDAGSGELQLRPVPGAVPTLKAPLSLQWQRLLWQAQALDTQGRLQGLSLAWIDALAALGQSAGENASTQTPGRGPLAASGLSGDLMIDGEWNLHVPADTAAPLTVSAALQRRSGDLRWHSGGNADASSGGIASALAAPVLAGVKDARVSLSARDGQVRALLRWDTERLGQVSADLSTELRPAPNDSLGASLIDRWWPASAPIRGSAQARLPQVGVWSMLAPPGWRMQGTLSADASFGGTRGQPEWRGTLQADQLALRSVVDGFSFTNGLLRATLIGDHISVDRFSLQGPGGAATGGTLEASGQAEWRAVPGSQSRQPFIELSARADRLRVSQRADRRLTLSGETSARLEGEKLQLRGRLKADSALFILPDELAPSLGDDVVVRSTRERAGEPDDAQRVQADVAIDLDLGPQFEVRGQGIQTRLEGKLSVQATPSSPTPRVLGEVRAANGTYRAYGQQLTIASGVLRFAGPYDDPSLDIRAVRPLPESSKQTVGVQIGGHAQAPRVSLFSDPELSDADKLAWLVLGRPASAAGAQAFVLQQAARQLLSRGGEPLDAELAQALGLDEIGFSGASTAADGTTTEAAFTVGKRLSNKLYLTYEQSLTGAMSTVSMLYDLSRNLTLRARAGTENAVDLIFTVKYD